MKILVLTNLYPPHHAGIHDFRCQTITEALRTRGHIVRVLASNHGMTTEQRGAEVERRLWLNGVFEHPRVTRFRELRAMEVHNHKVLRETIESFKPDVIHVHSLTGLSKSIIFALRQSRLPTVYDVADHWLMEGLRDDPWLRFWNQSNGPLPQKLWRLGLEVLGRRNPLDSLAPTRMMKGYDRIPQVYGDKGELAVVQGNSISAFRFDRLYFCSQALKTATEQAGFRVSHAEVIHPGLPTQLYVGEVKPAATPATKFLVVTQLNSASGVLTAVKALEIARENKLPAALSIYGRGDSDYVAEVRSYIAVHHLPVEFLPVSNIGRDLPPIYRRHDVLLHTTEWNEPYSLTPLEAMACGLPVIATETGGVGELLRHGENALTYSPGDEGMLALRMQEIQEQPKRRFRLAETAQQEVLSKFNETVAMDRIENYLQTSLEVWAHAAS